MENYYKILGLKSDATKDEVEERFNNLLKEFDPNNQSEDLKEFFTLETNKIKDAYEKISASLMETENIEKADDDILSDSNELVSKNNDSNETVEDKVSSFESQIDNDFKKQKNYNKKENYVFRNILLLFIASGVWGLFMQNMGFFVPSDDYAQNVRVVNTVATKVQGSVDVKGAVQVNNTVGIDIQAINGKYNAFYGKTGGPYYGLPVVTDW